MTNPLTDVVPARARKALYRAYAALGIAFGAVQVGFATAGQDQPIALLVAFAVFGYLGTALGVVAASNIGTTVRHVFDAGSISVDKITTSSLPAHSITTDTLTDGTQPPDPAE